jgi:IS5 family transposase
VVTQLNEALLKKADAAHLVKLDKVRADTTVVPANVAYPTDSGLLAKDVAKLARTVWSLKQMGFAARTCFRDRTRSVRRRAHSIGAWLRRRNDEAKTEVLAITGELADLAEATVADGRPRRRYRADSQALGTDRHPNTHPARRRGPRRLEEDRLAARQRCTADRQGQAGKAGRVRLQGTDHRQLRRHRLLRSQSQVADTSSELNWEGLGKLERDPSHGIGVAEQ